VTTSAWLMLGVTWGVVAGFCGWFFLRVLRTPRESPPEDT